MKKIIKTKLTKTRYKVKKHWIKFQQDKNKILSRKIGSELKQKKIRELRKKTYNKISNDFINYGLFRDKVLKVERSFKKYKQTHVIKGYKLKSYVGKANEKALQDYLTKLKDKDKIKNLLIIFQYKKISTCEIILKTESFSQPDFLKYLTAFDAKINSEYNEGEFFNELESIEGLSIYNLVQMKFESISETYLNDLKLEKIYIKVYYQE